MKRWLHFPAKLGMDHCPLCLLALIFAAAPSLAFGGRPKHCVTADEASKMLNKDVCVTAHVYEVVELPDGTRFLDVCPPQAPDAACRFTIISLWADRNDVGELMKYQNMDVHIRGIVLPMHGRAGIVLSHVRQFYGGPPKFRPNPRLMHGFNAGQDSPPLYDPNLHAHGGHRSFTNTRDQETRPTK
ncbi:MAG: hypothetical protein KGL37_04880 [Acidobacteriota bacterium]|nr:hypothetical protein [Acidobacteriota bacterium]